MAWEARSEPVIPLRRRCAFGLESSPGLVSFLAVIYSSQALSKACVEVFCSFGSGLWACSFPVFQSMNLRH